jgi:AcrR family transcriptional regulator
MPAVRTPRRRARKRARAAAGAAPPGGGLRARKKQQVRDAILAACGRLFRGRGFDETTIDDIAGEAEISRQTFFNYFPGKQAVLAELGLAWLGAQGERARAGARGDRPARLMAGFRRVLREQLAAVERDREFMRLVFTRSGLFFPHGPHVGSRADEPRLERTRAFFSGLASLIRAAQDAGELRRDVPADQIAEMYVAVLVVTIRLWLTSYWDARDGLVERGLRALDVLEDGLRARTRRA